MNALLEQNLALERSLEVQQELKRLLTTKSHISTTSSFAVAQEAAIGTNTEWREIGVGSRGRVFEQSGSGKVYKLATTTDNVLWNDYRMH